MSIFIRIFGFPLGNILSNLLPRTRKEKYFLFVDIVEFHHDDRVNNVSFHGKVFIVREQLEREVSSRAMTCSSHNYVRYDPKISNNKDGLAAGLIIKMFL